GERERPFACTRCGKRFAKSTSLVRHNLTHTGERPHQCSQCGKTFLTSGELLLHKRIHTHTTLSLLLLREEVQVLLRPQHSFSTSTRLKRHMRTHMEKGIVVESLKTAFNQLNSF
uniref:C2H2-type domain-containing protein n=1 Tax=Lates calcarifer TaxID=8187 RepID=A0A4W6FGL0_LATCA